MPDYIVKIWLENWVKVVVCGIVSAILLQYRKYFAYRKGTQVLLKAQLLQFYNKYSDRGEVPIYARETICELYEQYKALGGNGTMTVLMQKLNNLPTRHDEEGA